MDAGDGAGGDDEGAIGGPLAALIELMVGLKDGGWLYALRGG